MLALRNRHFFLIDLLLLPAAAVAAFALRLDARGMEHYVPALLWFIAFAVPFKLLLFRALGLYRRYWRYASVDEMLLIVLLVSLSTAVLAVLVLGLVLPLDLLSCPRSIPFLDGLVTLVVIAGPRLSVRLLEQRRQRQRRRQGANPEVRVLVVGAGDAGSMIVKEMQANPQLGFVPLGFIDDDEGKHGVQIHGVPVLGGRARIPEAVQKLRVTQVIIAMPTAPGSVIRDILTICKEAGVPARTIPGIYHILSGQASVGQIREVDIEDLLRREPVQTDTTAVTRMLRGRRVLVTGAGGSIGSELCRQIARCRPAELVLVGHGENSIFAISNELQWLWPELTVRRVIADVRDEPRLQQIFHEHRPDVVFHAAAHKHVPLMEENAAEAVTNNILGTATLLRVAQDSQVACFVLISTDKAVNPTSVMGATKRVAEMLVQEAAHRSGRAYVAVRFGNVLDSRGSVVPTFREQIRRGGPVTVTHPEVRRYFMTIPEAVQLVLQAATLGQGGEVFVLDMGEPIRIVDLAKDLIRLSGLEVGRDIDIVYTGLRPGEKVFEELFLQGEEYVRTQHDKVFISRNGSPVPCYPANLAEAVQELVAIAQRGDEAAVRAKLAEIVPEYEPGSREAGEQGSNGEFKELQGVGRVSVGL